jgi:predicted GH43/DUF377 family glycosyl hydrolase
MEQRSYLKGRLAATTSGSRSRPTCCTGAGTPASRGRDRACGDSARVGAGAAPIRTPAGWLEIYHGADSEHRYCLGALLLDLQQPWKVLARSPQPIMEPIADYERTGFFGNVVFTNGHLVHGDTATLYYGASDSVICGARFSIQEILQALH